MGIIESAQVGFGVFWYRSGRVVVFAATRAGKVERAVDNWGHLKPGGASSVAEAVHTPPLDGTRSAKMMP